MRTLLCNRKRADAGSTGGITDGTALGAAKKQGNTACDNCLKAHWSSFSAAGCDVKSAEGYCGGKPSKPSQKGGTQYKPYETTYFRPGQTSTSCPTGLMFNSSWDEGVGSGP